MKINVFWGELTDNSAKKEALVTSTFVCWILYKTCTYVAAGISGVSIRVCIYLVIHTCVMASLLVIAPITSAYIHAI